jgi:nucleotide-binding universal stress UspA family protein
MEINFLVPHDFTPVGDSAALQGAYICSATNSTLSLLHIVKSDKLKPEAENNLKAVKAKILDNFPSLNIKLYVIAGNIFDDIGGTAKKLGSSAIIMGTHGAKGMQKVFGSFAIKVITSCSTPFMVVQNDVTTKRFEKILFPMGIMAETLQIMGFMTTLAKAFDAEVHILAEAQSDAKLKSKTNINFQVVAKQMAANQVRYKMELLDGNDSYVDKILSYAKKVNADLIGVAYYNESFLPTLDRFYQTLLTNELNIPSLMVNSKSVSSSYF